MQQNPFHIFFQQDKTRPKTIKTCLADASSKNRKCNNRIYPWESYCKVHDPDRKNYQEKEKEKDLLKLEKNKKILRENYEK